MAQGRAVLQKVLDGRITFAAEGSGYRFEARTRFLKLVAGLKVPRPAWIGYGLVGADNIAPEDVRLPDPDFAGRVVPRPAWIGHGSSGLEHLAPEDLPDYDFGLLLERAYALVLASPTGLEPLFA